MIKATINAVEYDLPTNWDEIKLSRAILAHETFKDMPDSLFKTYEAANKRDTELVTKLQAEMTDEELLKDYPEYYGKFICALTDIPQEVMQYVGCILRTNVFYDYFDGFLRGLLFAPDDYLLKGIKHFTHNGVKYYFPKDGLSMVGTLPGKDMNPVEFAHSADLLVAATKMKDGNYDRMRQVVAIICREKDKPYEEQDMLRRADEFKDLPMSVVWEVYFFMLDSLTRSVLRTPSSLRRVVIPKRGSQRRKAGYRHGGGMGTLLRWQKMVMSKGLRV